MSVIKYALETWGAKIFERREDTHTLLHNEDLSGQTLAELAKKFPNAHLEESWGDSLVLVENIPETDEKFLARIYGLFKEAEIAMSRTFPTHN